MKDSSDTLKSLHFITGTQVCEVALIPFDIILFSKLKKVPDAFQSSGTFRHCIIIGFLPKVAGGDGKLYTGLMTLRCFIYLTGAL